MKQITIDPITRLEGHGKIEIFLTDDGDVANVYFQVPELRGFEKFIEGRPAEEVPQIVTKICGNVPAATTWHPVKPLIMFLVLNLHRLQKKIGRAHV